MIFIEKESKNSLSLFLAPNTLRKSEVSKCWANLLKINRKKFLKKVLTNDFYCDILISTNKERGKQNENSGYRIRNN